MNLPTEIDVLIAGGGIAGVAVAAALREFGCRVCIVEPGLDDSKRLAGELIHPPGAAALAELGLLSALENVGGVSVSGFAVSLSPDAPVCMLPYAEIPGCVAQGLALEHGLLRKHLLAAIATCPNVTVCHGARITAIDVRDPQAAVATIENGGSSVRVKSSLLVAADGGSSRVSAMAGIGRRRTRISHMLGLLLKNSALPYPGFGNVFLGGPAPILAYEISSDTVRVMFDLPEPAEPGAATDHVDAYLSALPQAFRDAVKSGLVSSRTLRCANYSFVPDSIARNRLVLVGDAAGCCHPLTATGLSISARDAIRLRDALRECHSDIPAALTLYAERRRRPQRTRMVLAHTLYETFKGRTPEMRLMREGLLHYWVNRPRGRSLSMALLSTHETRMTRMASQYAAVLYYALRELVRRGDGKGDRSVLARSRLMLGMSRATMAYATQTLKEW